MEKEGKKIPPWVKLIGLLYLFIFSIELIKKATTILAPDIQTFFSNGLTPLKAVCTGWFSTSVVQSSGAISTITATFAGNNLINLTTAVYIIIGATIGAAITALIISIITTTKKRRDFRHGFEIGLCFAIYSLILVIIIFILEYFFHAISKTSLFLGNAIHGKSTLLQIPNIVEIITLPLIKLLRLNNFLILIIAFALLIISLKYLGKTIIEVLGGERKAREFVNKYFKSKYKAYLIGAILTGIVFSSSITIGLLVPLAISRLINLKKAIPFIIGARFGTFTDVFLASLIINKPLATATAMAYFLFGALGTLIFLPNTNLLLNITKHISKKTIHISRKKALYFLIAFILIPLAIILFF